MLKTLLLSVIIGLASYYSDRFEGKRTASGETFRQAKLTAASNVYRFGTYVKVTNISNNKSVIVKINDRVKNPNVLIDLSESAARQLGFIRKGVIKVKVEKIK
jgi:rare lipoprotein A